MRTFVKMTAAALLLLTAAALQAQPGGGPGRMSPEQRAEQQTTNMTEQLSLSEAQSSKVGEINLKYAQKMKELRASADGDRDAMRAAMGTIRQEQDAELQTVLTQDQWKKWDAYRQEQRANLGGGNPPPPPADAPPPSDSGKKSKKKKGQTTKEEKM
ncbi:MAG: DUF4890 domain-containing protein [Saprospiraceae bacterium]|nr:DUF4890 domain-containing protein [Saprospiraceae bacterium]